MLARFGRAALGAVIGSFAGAAVTYILTLWLSPNPHDLELEAAMTAAFAGGPLGAILGLVVGFCRRRRTPRTLGSPPSGRA